MDSRDNIDIKDIQKFAKVFNEFKIQGYDANSIIYEYSQTRSFRRKETLFKQEVD